MALAAIGWWARSGPPTTISPSTSASAAAAARPMLVVSSPRRLTFEDGCEEYPSFMPDGRTIAYDAYADGADRLMLLDVESGARRVLTNDDAWRYQASLSPDGTRLTFSQQKDEDWSTWVMSVDGTGARELAKGEAAAMWTPDGRAIWAGDDPLVRRLDVDTLAPSAEQRTLTGYALTGILELEDGRLVARLYDRASHAVDRIVVFPHPGADPIDVWHGEHEEVLARTRDGAALVISKTMPTKTHELWRVPLDGSPPAPLGAAGVDATKGLAFSRDHRRMVWSTCVTDSVISAIDADGGGFAPVFPKHEWSDFEATAIPGTPRIIALSDRGGSRAPWVLDTSGREPPRMLDVAGRAASDFAVSRDGRWLAFTSAGHGVEVMPLDGSAPPRRVSPDDRDANPSFSRVGTRVYFQMKREGHTHVAAVPLEGGEARVIAEDATLPNASPVDDALAYVTRDGDVRVIEVASGRSRPLSSSIKRGKHTAVRFSEDGRRVAVTNGETEIVEVDARSRTVLRRFANRATPMVSVFYFDRRIGFTSTVWRGDLWIADVEER